MATAAHLANRHERPRRVKMWARDFIDGQCKVCLLKYCSYGVRRGDHGTCGGVGGGRVRDWGFISLTSGNPLTNPFPPPFHSPRLPL